MSEQRDDAVDRERELEQHEREARERDQDERRPGERAGDLGVDEDRTRKPAPPGNVDV